MHSLAPERWIQMPVHAGGLLNGKQLCRKGVGFFWAPSYPWLRMCLYGKEGQQHPGLYETEQHQQIKWCDPLPYFSPSYAVCGVHVQYWLSQSKRDMDTGACLAKDNKNYNRCSDPLIWRQAERAETVQDGKEKAQRIISICINSL